jgi:predicted transcriptional regulator
MSVLSIEISDEVMERLQILAQEHRTSLEKLIQVTLLDLVEYEDEEEPTIEDIQQMVEEAIQADKAGQLRSLDEFLDELDLPESDEAE